MFKNTEHAKILKEKRGGKKKMVRGVSRKGAMELSMNTIVVVVIGITLLVLGLVFVRGIFDKIRGTTEKVFAEADTELEDMMGTEQRINVQTTINIQPGRQVKIPIKMCNIEGLGNSLKLKVIAYKLTGTKVKIYIPELPGLKEITGDGEKIATNIQSLSTGRCVAYQMFLVADSSAPITAGESPMLTFKAMAGTEEYGSTGSIVTVSK